MLKTCNKDHGRFNIMLERPWSLSEVIVELTIPNKCIRTILTDS